MKNLIFITLLFSILPVFGQNATIDKTLEYGQTYINFSGVAADTIGVGDSTWTYTVYKKSDDNIYPYIYTDLAVVAGGTPDTVLVILQGKVFANQSFTALDTVIWRGNPDNAITPFDYTTANKNQIWRVMLQGSNDAIKARVSKLDFYFPK